MVRRLLSVLAVACCAALCFAVYGVGRAGPAQQFFPLQAGTSWTFQESATQSNSTMSVAAAANGVFQLTGVPFLGDAIVTWSGDTLRIWDASEQRWEDFLRFGAPTGTSYPVQLGSEAGNPWSNVQITLAERDAAVTLRSRHEPLRDALRFHFDFGAAPAEAALRDAVFVPALGPVSFRAPDFAGGLDVELVGGIAQADAGELFTPQLSLRREADGEFTLEAETLTPSACHSAGTARTGAPSGIIVLPEVQAVTLVIQVRRGLCADRVTPVRHRIENLRLGEATAKSSVSAFAVINGAVVGRARINVRSN